jgi:hypothetical protein
MNLTKKRKVINYLSKFSLIRSDCDCENCPLGWRNFKNIANLKEIVQDSFCSERAEHLAGIKFPRESSCTVRMDILKKFFERYKNLTIKLLDNE